MFEKLENIYRRFFPKHMLNYRLILAHLKGMNGLEIGGPSASFASRGFLPVYDVVNALDGCNFSNKTIWEGNIQEGKTYKFGSRIGQQIISDGTRLDQISDLKYDFILSCHSIEHIANPIKALLEWKRIIREQGFILLIVPHKDHTFDHKRPITKIEHLIKDFENDVQENDTTHFEEIIALHDIVMDSGVNDQESLIKRTEDNFKNRSAHHHVFNTPLVVMLADYLKFKICQIQHFNPFNIVLLLQKSDAKIPDNSVYLDKENLIYKNKNFLSDKIW